MHKDVEQKVKTSRVTIFTVYNIIIPCPNLKNGFWIIFSEILILKLWKETTLPNIAPIPYKGSGAQWAPLVIPNIHGKSQYYKYRYF